MQPPPPEKWREMMFRYQADPKSLGPRNKTNKPFPQNLKSLTFRSYGYLNYTTMKTTPSVILNNMKQRKIR